MRRGAYQYNYNSPIGNTQAYVDKARPFQTLPDIFYVTNGAGHQYNGLTVEAKRQLAKGLYFQSGWTWARDRYDMDYNWDFDNPQFTLEDPRNRQREIGPAKEIPTHRFSSNFIYQLPFGKGRQFGTHMSRAANLLAGGWELTGIYTAQTGMFLTPFWTGDDPVGITFTDSSTPASVTLRPDGLRNANLSGSQQTLSRWFDPTAFASPQPGQFGTSGKGVIKGPGINVFSAGLAKEFLFGEHAKLRWEMTATNFFNHPNWANPSTDITDTTGVGVITSDGGITSGSVGDRSGARAFRMGLRLQF